MSELYQTWTIFLLNEVRKLLLTKGVARASFDVGSSIDRQCRGRPPVQRVFTMHGSRLLLAVCTGKPLVQYYQALLPSPHKSEHSVKFNEVWTHYNFRRFMFDNNGSSAETHRVQKEAKL